ncbi:MAG: hypothetical protein ACRDWD_02335 [Acidimicrobiia bacterium]
MIHDPVIRSAAMKNLELVTPVAYEPCTHFQADEVPEVCTGCGWAEDDHEVLVVGPADQATKSLRRVS